MLLQAQGPESFQDDMGVNYLRANRYTIVSRR